MKVAIVGSREIGDFSIEKMLPKIPPQATELISGGAPGVDTIAVQVALLLDLPIRIFSPDYEKYGRMAPLLRNRQIVDCADLVLAFWDNHSKGTAHTLKYCIETQKPFRIYLFNELANQ